VTIGGPNPTDLHFHAGSKDHGEEIMSKIQSSRAIAKGAAQPESRDSSPQTPPPAATDKAASMKKPSVHFSTASPTVIPPAPRADESDEEDYDQSQANAETGEIAVALYDFNADGEDELTVVEGEKLEVLERDGDEWWKCRNAKGYEGVVPAQYLEVCCWS